MVSNIAFPFEKRLNFFDTRRKLADTMELVLKLQEVVDDGSTYSEIINLQRSSFHMSHFRFRSYKNEFYGAKSRTDC